MGRARRSNVRLVAPTAERPAITAITVGMSERPMVAGDRELSCELVLVLPPSWSFEYELATWPLLPLDQIAHFPHEYGTYLGPGHTIQNPYPWSPNGFTGAMSADQVLTPSEAAEVMTHDGREIRLLGVWFLYGDEMQFKLDEGVEDYGIFVSRQGSPRRSIRSARASPRLASAKGCAAAHVDRPQ